MKQSTKTRPTNRLRMRKGRSIVHKSIEDNYGAVVIANHEALAQVLEQVSVDQLLLNLTKNVASVLILP